MRGVDIGSRTRFAPDARRQQIREVAETQLLEVGCLPLSLEKLAAGVGVSKALIYRYFETQEELFNEVLTARLAGMRDSLAKLTSDTLRKGYVVRGLNAYFHHVSEAGPVMRFILRDPFMKGKFSAEAKALLKQIAEPFENALVREEGIGHSDARVGLQLLVAIPEETAMLVRRRELKADIAEQLCDELISAGVAGLKKSAVSRLSPRSR